MFSATDSIASNTCGDDKSATSMISRGIPAGSAIDELSSASNRMESLSWRHLRRTLSESSAKGTTFRLDRPTVGVVVVFVFVDAVPLVVGVVGVDAVVVVVVAAAVAAAADVRGRLPDMTGGEAKKSM